MAAQAPGDGLTAMACPIPSPEAPMVQALLEAVDCHVLTLVTTAYGALFQPSGALAGVLTSLLVIVVALLGYRLMLGLGALRVGDLALTASKIGLVLAFTTQWALYQGLVFDFFFVGPKRLADGILVALGSGQSVYGDDAFGSLQQTLDFLAAHAEGYVARAPAATSPFVGGASFGALLLTLSSSILLLSSLGILLAAKIVLGLLLALGPIFIALALFDTTRGFFEGWLRATVAAAFAPLATTILLGLGLALLQPWLLQLAEARAAGQYPLAPAQSILTLVLVLSAVSVGMVGAGGAIAAGFKIPVAGPALSPVAAHHAEPRGLTPEPERAQRIAAAVAIIERRSASAIPSAAERRTDVLRVETAPSTAPGATKLATPEDLRRPPAPKSRRSRSP